MTLLRATFRDIWYGKLVPNSELLGKFGHYLETFWSWRETTRFGTPQDLGQDLKPRGAVTSRFADIKTTRYLVLCRKLSVFSSKDKIYQNAPPRINQTQDVTVV
jgi:hypothetical protein